MASLIAAARRVWDGLTTRQRAQMVVAAAATLALIWAVVAYGNRVRYATLYDAVEMDDAAEIVAALKQRNVAYRLMHGGRAIEVPAGRVDDLRMELAGDGLPRGGGVGFEIFDKPSFGLSTFVQNVNYRRALERELGRSIQSFDNVETARVHLALPAESLFADEKRQPSASVVLRLRGDPSPRTEQVRAIAHLVASGVEGLEASRVSVVDGQGHMLSDGGGDAGDASLSADQLEAKRSIERRIETTLVTILEPVVGRDRVRARATVELETARVQRVEERYDPDGAVVRSEQRNKTSQGGNTTGGAAGSDANLPSGSPVAARAASEQQSQTSTTNFEINKTVSTIAEPSGRLLRQSVAVVVDHAMQKGQDDNGADVLQATPRSEQEMTKITALVRAAAGIDESRGDVLTVENVGFDTSAHTQAPASGIDWLRLATRVSRYLVLPLAVLLIAFLIVRPAISTVRALSPAADAPERLATVAEMQARIAGGGLLRDDGGSTLRQKLIEAANADPEAAALIVRGWVDGRDA